MRFHPVFHHKLTYVSTTIDNQVARKPQTYKVSNFALKMIMAVSGLMFAAFVFIHMFGNLKAFQGAEAYNYYSHWLREAFYPFLPKGSVLWALRIALLVGIVGHVSSAFMLTSRAHKARGSHRRKGMPIKSFTARTMLVSGIVILGFAIFHISDLTLGIAGAEGFQHSTADETFAYQNMVASFQRPVVAIFYMIALLTLWAHLAHGLWTVVNDFGVTGPRLRSVLLVIGGVFALLVMAGNIFIPLLVMLGVIA